MGMNEILPYGLSFEVPKDEWDEYFKRTKPMTDPVLELYIRDVNNGYWITVIMPHQHGEKPEVRRYIAETSDEVANEIRRLSGELTDSTETNDYD